MRALFLVSRWLFPCYALKWQRAQREASFLVSLLRTLIPLWEPHFHDLITSHRLDLQTPSLRRLSFNIWIWGEQKHAVHNIDIFLIKNPGPMVATGSAVLVKYSSVRVRKMWGKWSFWACLLSHADRNGYLLIWLLGRWNSIKKSHILFSIMPETKEILNKL